MVLKRTAAYPATEASQVGEIRRAAAKLASSLGFSEEDEARVAIVATELANNLVNHASGKRELLLQRVDGAGVVAVEMIAVDTGPGIRNMANALRDGFSTAGSAGQGLGAIDRLSTFFDIYSQPDRGTAVLSRIYPRNIAAPPQEVGALAVPMPGEDECGDACAWELNRGRGWFMIADGLGHGPIAAQASAAAVMAFERAACDPAVRRLERVHEALKGTRGAAVGIAETEAGRPELQYAGLGNVAGVVAGSRVRSMVSLHGTAGQGEPRISSFAAEWSPTSVLIMHSDGLTTRWDIASYPGILMKHPSIIAAVLYRDFARTTDDASVLVYRPPR